MTKIAVLSSHLSETLNWLKSGSSTIDYARRTVETEHERYYIVSSPEHILGMTFDKYMRAPDFYTLEDLIKMHVRQS